MISYTKTLLLSTIMLVIGYSTGYSMESQNTSTSQDFVDINEISSDKYNKYVSTNSDNLNENINNNYVYKKPKVKDFKNVYKKPKVKTFKDVNKKSTKNSNINDEQINKLKERFDEKMNELAVLSWEIREKFPQCEETENILKLIKEFKKLCYVPSIEDKDGRSVGYIYSQIKKELEQFLPEDSEYKQILKKAPEYNMFYSENTYDKCMNLNKKQVKIIEKVRHLFNELFGIHTWMVKYNVF